MNSTTSHPQRAAQLTAEVAHDSCACHHVTLEIADGPAGDGRAHGYLTSGALRMEVVLTWQQPADATSGEDADHLLRAVAASLSAALGREDQPAPARRQHGRTALTRRESESARLVGKGRTNAEIASELFISAKTVEYYLSNLNTKLNISNRRQLRDLVQDGALALTRTDDRPLRAVRRGRPQLVS
jgi:DNA-binding CsgD family transcriptional regulator